MSEFKKYVLIVAAGKGVRMKSDTRKQYLKLDHIPILTRTILAFDLISGIDDIMVVVPENDKEYCLINHIEPFDFKKRVYLTGGGEQRQDSVYNGLLEIKKNDGDFEKSFVLIHDGVRPFVSASLVQACIEGAAECGACVPALKISDTVKQSKKEPKKKNKTFGVTIDHTLDRDCLYSVQTPQTFRLDLILEAFEYAKTTGFSGTDDASLIEHFGQMVCMIPGSKSNIKITTPEDMEFACLLLDYWKKL